MADASGYIDASIPGLAHAARVPIPSCEEAITCFLAPDPYSRTKDNDGRRIEAVDGGWRILTYQSHRERATSVRHNANAAIRMREIRARRLMEEEQKEDVPNVPDELRDVPNVPQAEARQMQRQGITAAAELGMSIEKQEIAEALIMAKIAEPALSDLLKTPGITAKLVRDLNRQLKAKGKRTGVLILELRRACSESLAQQKEAMEKAADRCRKENLSRARREEWDKLADEAKTAYHVMVAPTIASLIRRNDFTQWTPEKEPEPAAINRFWDSFEKLNGAKPNG